jgi:hypothetical protein
VGIQNRLVQESDECESGNPHVLRSVAQANRLLAGGLERERNLRTKRLRIADRLAIGSKAHYHREGLLKQHREVVQAAARRGPGRLRDYYSAHG